MSPEVARVRPATSADLPAMAAMAADLVRFHHAIDPARFFLARGVEQGYREWFTRELARREAILLVAELANSSGPNSSGPNSSGPNSSGPNSSGPNSSGPNSSGTDAELAGYAYGRLEPRDWNLLLDRHAALHDVFVSERARRTGTGERLVRAFCARARELGAPRVVLSTATSNARAQALFARCGFRPTMIEMTRESDPDDDQAGAL